MILIMREILILVSIWEHVESNEIHNQSQKEERTSLHGEANLPMSLT